MTIISLTGASGAGKSTLEHSLAKYFGGGLIARTTTRPPRSANEPGHEFISVDDMQNLASFTPCVLPPVIVHGNWYAAKESAFITALAETNGRFACTVTNPDRHQMVREYFAQHGLNTLAIHLLSPSEEELRRRLNERNWSDSELEFRVRASKHFDKWASRLSDIHLLDPDTKSNIFNKSLRLIEDT